MLLLLFAYCEKMTKEMNHEHIDQEEDFQKQASGTMIQEAGQSTKAELKRYAFKVLL